MRRVPTSRPNLTVIDKSALLPAEQPKLIGFQVADLRGNNIQGEADDPTGYASFEVMTPALAVHMVETYGGFLLMPIFEGMIEEPRIVDLPAPA